MKRLTVLALMMAGSLAALEYRPWLPEPFIPTLRASYDLEHYNKIREGNSTTDLSATSHLLALGGEMGIWYYSSYDVQAEVGCAATRQHSFGFEDATVMGRVQLADDISGASPASVTAGIQLSYVRDKYVSDYSLFHHGKWETFGHIAVGKECPCGPFWSQRVWGMAGLGSAETGSMWVYSKISFEQNCRERFFYGLFVDGLVGFGARPLDIDNFYGYGGIHHRSVNLGAFLQYSIGEWAWLRAEYAYRPWAENFPTNLHRGQIAVYYPFSL